MQSYETLLQPLAKIGMNKLPPNKEKDRFRYQQKNAGLWEMLQMDLQQSWIY